MKKPLRVMSTRFEKVESMPIAILICEDGTEVLVPAEAFVVLAARARQYLSSTKTNLIAGEWVAARYQPVGQIRTGTTDNGRVALQLDPGTDSELCLSLDPKTARELGQLLANLPVPDPSRGRQH
jgi:hypothetical protein